MSEQFFSKWTVPRVWDLYGPCQKHHRNCYENNSTTFLYINTCHSPNVYVPIFKAQRSRVTYFTWELISNPPPPTTPHRTHHHEHQEYFHSIFTNSVHIFYVFDKKLSFLGKYRSILGRPWNPPRASHTTCSVARQIMCLHRLCFLYLAIKFMD